MATAILRLLDTASLPRPNMILPEVMLILLLNLFTIIEHDGPPFSITEAIMPHHLKPGKMGLFKRLRFTRYWKSFSSSSRRKRSLTPFLLHYPQNPKLQGDLCHRAACLAHQAHDLCLELIGESDVFGFLS